MVELNVKIENCPFMNHICATYGILSPTGDAFKDCDVHTNVNK